MRRAWIALLVACATAAVTAAPQFVNVWKSPEVARLNFAVKTEGVVALRPVSRQAEREYSPVVWGSSYYQSFWGYYGYGWHDATVVRRSKDTTVVVVETLVYDLARDPPTYRG